MKNGPIPLTTLKNVNVDYQSLQQHYDALKSAIDKLDKYKVNVDNCGFTECQKCQSCQSCQSCQKPMPYDFLR